MNSFYPQNNLHRSSAFITMFDTTLLPYNKCNGKLCYTQSKSDFIYKPHSGYGRVGTTASAYLSRRKRI
jgi:hypothetical protein